MEKKKKKEKEQQKSIDNIKRKMSMLLLLLKVYMYFMYSVAAATRPLSTQPLKFLVHLCRKLGRGVPKKPGQDEFRWTDVVHKTNDAKKLAVYPSSQLFYKYIQYQQPNIAIICICNQHQHRRHRHRHRHRHRRHYYRQLLAMAFYFSLL
uniref:Uncharacterized protein n=1 Tax=Glossina austeni TaxID=7395 RepID=A0A1A9VJ59_GLOAU